VVHRLLKPPRQSDLYDAISLAVAGVGRGRVEEEAETSVSPVAADAPLVLVAEDNEVNRMVATTLLHRRGLRTEVATNGEQAVRMAADRRYAAIFMDCQMPELDGYEATKRIRGADPDRRVPIIAMTANAMPGDRERCLAVGMDDYLAKPIDPGQLDAALDRWLPRNGQLSLPGGTGAPAEADSATQGDDRLLEPEVIERLRQDLAPELRKRLLETFEAQLAARLPELEMAAERPDREELRRLLHLLKGSSATIGAAALSQACGALEGQAEDGLAENDGARLRQLAQATLVALRSELLLAKPPIAIY
jgi:CheY-like chemotaxis protein/HPt (histidine-containing phosphotransfer) domain-containing protein